jgi:hypothetical protein
MLAQFPLFPVIPARETACPVAGAARLLLYWQKRVDQNGNNMVEFLEWAMKDVA